MQMKPLTRLDIASQRHAVYYNIVLDVANHFYLSGDDGIVKGLWLFDLERANFETGQAWAAVQIERDDVAAEICINYIEAGGDVLALRQHPQDRVRWLEAAVTASRRLKNHLSEGIHLGNLGNSYAALGQLQRAVEVYEQALAISRKFADRSSESAELGNLGNVFAEMGDMKRAIESYEQSLT